MRALAGGPDRWPPTGPGVHCQHSCDIEAWDRHAKDWRVSCVRPIDSNVRGALREAPLQTIKHGAASEP